MSLIIVKSVPGRILKDPLNAFRPLLPEGSPVEDSAYWRRRINDGDAIEVKPEIEAPAVEPSTNGGSE